MRLPTALALAGLLVLPSTAQARRAHHVVPHSASGAVLAHPAGCPRVLFCACGAAVWLLGSAHAASWLAAAWLRFPRAAPAPRMAGVRAHHVVALIEYRGGSVWSVYDANSGHHATRIHDVDISRYTIVDPHG